MDSGQGTMDSGQGTVNNGVTADNRKLAEAWGFASGAN